MSPVTPGTISPRRPVPAHIDQPEYVDQPAPLPFRGSEVKDAETIEKMRIASRLAAQAREEVGSHVTPGVTTDELDRIGQSTNFNGQKLLDGNFSGQFQVGADGSATSMIGVNAERRFGNTSRQRAIKLIPVSRVVWSIGVPQVAQHDEQRPPI